MAGYGYRKGYVPRDPIPPGWADCPDMGEVSDIHNMIPMKVPLGDNHRIRDMGQRSGYRFTPEKALHMAHEKVTQRNPDAKIGMVLDLSNSDKYYDPECFTTHSVRYVKVPCRGRGQSPDPLAVNMAVWEIRKTLAQADVYILVHCTHGFNRSGFIIVCAALRLLAERGFCVERLLRRFAEQRPPGIYKDEYISDLFRRHNEMRPPMARTPALPLWKPADDEDEDERLGVGYTSHASIANKGRMTHSDKVGEAICQEEAKFVLCVVYDIIQGQDLMQKGMLSGYPHQPLLMQNSSPGDYFVGSQPVSLAAENLSLVQQKRYFVTWKADGTRYLMLLSRFGTYLVDRSGEVRRVHLRFPTLLPPSKRSEQAHPVGGPHDHTLLDGEMVVDDVDLDGLQQRRRFLVYDLMMLSGEGVGDLRFQDRYKMVEREVVRPRELEKNFYSKNQKGYPNFLYNWSLEAFSVRQKEFWPLNKARKLLDQFIPRLCHESDGLILQPWDDPYIPRTYPHLLKWKFRHMNSVDFKLSALPGKPVLLQLNCAMRRKHGQADVNHLSLQEIGLGEQRVEFPEDVDPVALHGRIVECSFDVERRCWVYMRDRPDKLTANHRSVFEKVMTSITDNITQLFAKALCIQADATHADAEGLQQQNGHHPSAAAVMDDLAAATEPPGIGSPDYVANQHSPDQEQREQQHGIQHGDHADDDQAMDSAMDPCSDPSQLAQEEVVEEEEEEYKVTEMDDEGADFVEEEL
eukprot:gene11715-11860_t